MKHKLRNLLDIMLFLMVLIFISTLYIISQWPYTPEDAIKQGSQLGPFAVLADLIFFLIIAFLWLRNKGEKE